MARVEKTVFISYRRTNAPWALAIFQNLHNNGYDVFFDYEGIASGDFEGVILGNIRRGPISLCCSHLQHSSVVTSRQTGCDVRSKKR